jgi:hypothetical protein
MTMDDSELKKLVDMLVQREPFIVDEEAAKLKKLVNMFLLGWVDRNGHHQFFKFGSREECAAQYAIARLLRFYAQFFPGTPKPEESEWWFLDRLAALFDPSTRPHPRGNALKVTFSFRREGGPGQVLRHRRIAKEMRAAVRAGQQNKVKAPVRIALKAAMEEHGIGEEQAKVIWGRYGKPMMS